MPGVDEGPFEKYYSSALDYIEQFVEGKMDPLKFEDTIREMFGINSYPVHTIDKVIQSLAKQAQLGSEDRSDDLYALYLSEQQLRSRPDVEYTAQAEALYRSQAERRIGDEVTFRIVFVSFLLLLLLFPCCSNSGIFFIIFF